MGVSPFWVFILIDTGRLATGAERAPVLGFAGKATFLSASPIWGDYSQTSLDPDGLTFWTIQEYAENPDMPAPAVNSWGTRIFSITPF
jgi:hypothetical protein